MNTIEKALENVKAVTYNPHEDKAAFKRRLECELDYLRSQKCREWEAHDQENSLQELSHGLKTTYNPKNFYAGAYTRGSNGVFRRHGA